MPKSKPMKKVPLAAPKRSCGAFITAKLCMVVGVFAVTGAVEESADEKHGEILGKGEEEHRGKHAYKGWDGGCHNPESVNDNADEGANHDEPEGIYGEEKADIVHPHAQGIEGHIGGDRRHGQGDASHND